ALLEGGLVPDRTILVFGALRDKDFRPMLERLAPLADRRFYAPPKGRAPADPEGLAVIAEGTPCASPDEAIMKARDTSGAGDTILVPGSSYLVGELRARILNLPLDPAVGL